MFTTNSSCVDPQHRRSRAIAGVLIAACIISYERPTPAYSVLAHEGTVDSAWDREIVPLLRQRFPRVTAAELTEARAYAYGGSLIQDLGYYPFGSHLFTNLTHYVRTGDFVESLIRGATDVNEYAFALGALAHYASDNAGHPLAVNRAVPLMYPKMREKVGREALYIDSPARHVMVEFAFDVLQVAKGAYRDQAYHDRIGFRVSKPLIERAVRETYAIDLGDLLMNVDLAIGTYRRAVSTTIPELTRLAWRDKRKEIEAATPGVAEREFVYQLTKQQYEKEFGTTYHKAGFFARLLVFASKIMPKIGPFRPLAFEPLSVDAERLFVESLNTSRARYRALLQALRTPGWNLPNTDFDTGKPPVLGVNRLPDKTHADLLDKVSSRNFADVSPQLRQQLTAFFAHASEQPTHFKPKETARINAELARLADRLPSGVSR